MNRVLQGSLFVRLLTRFAALCRESGVCRLGRRFRAAARDSRTRRAGAAVLGAPARQSENARAASLPRRWNLWLWRVGRHAVPVVEQSLLCRAVRAVFRCGRNSKLLGWLLRGGVRAVLLTALGGYAVVDYLLRDALSIPVLSSLWDEALLLLCFLHLVWERMRAPRPLPARPNPLDTPVLLFFAAGFCLLFIAAPFFSIGVEGYRATVQYMLFFFLLTRLLRDDGDLMRVYLVMLACAFLIALHGIYQYIVAVPIPSHWTDQAEQSVRTRVFSIFGSPNIMGDFMVMFAPMAAGLAYYVKDRRLKLLCWFATFCMCFSCLFTMSRGAWMAMAVAVLLFALLVDRRLLGLMLAAGAFSMFLPFVASRIGYLLTPQFAESTTNGGRASRWILAMRYLEESPLFGVGLGMFGGAVAMQHKVYPWVSYFYVDNYYLKILVEMGCAGLAVFILLLLCLLFTGLRAAYRASRVKDGSSLYPLCAGMLSGLCGVLVHCYFENIFEEPYMMAYFWSIAAMIVYIGFLREKQGQR